MLLLPKYLAHKYGSGCITAQEFSGSHEKITLELFKEELRSELEAVEREFTSDALSVRKFSEAAKLLSDLVEDRQLAPFLTLEAYHLI